MLLLCPGASTEAKGACFRSQPVSASCPCSFIANVLNVDPVPDLARVSGNIDTLYTDFDLVLPGHSPVCGRCAQCWEGKACGAQRADHVGNDHRGASPGT